MLKIYIANLGKYNEGELVGKWVELPCEDLDEVLKEIEVVDGTAYEEYAIHDYESDIEGLNIGEYDNIFSLAIYIDYAAIARDLECDSYFETKQGVIYLC